MSIKWKSSLDGTGPIMIGFPVNNTQTITKSSLIVLTSNKASLAADEAAVNTVLGVADNAITTTTAALTDIVYVDVNPHSIYEMSYVGSATPTVGTTYDMGGATATDFDSDDTTNGFIQVVGNVDTTALTADVILINRLYGVT